MAARLLGGVAVRLHADHVPSPLRREYKDLDFVSTSGAGKATARELLNAGYEPDETFNALYGKRRLLFFDPFHDRQVDVFVGQFRMCHAIPLDGRIEIDRHTLPLAELLMTKLQVVELNEKDLQDALLVLLGHGVADSDGDAVNVERIATVCSDDWGLWRTLTRNLELCKAGVDRYDLPEESRKRIVARIETAMERIDAAPKSRGWKLRARIGERKRWYELPDEVD